MQTRFSAAIVHLMLSLFPTLLLGQEAPGTNIPSESVKDFELRLLSEHPAQYFGYARVLWYSGNRDKAVFWYYAGMLRYRYHLLATKPTDQSGDPALFASLRSMDAEPIYLYAGNNFDKFSQQIDDVLKWDLISPNDFTKKEAYPKEYEDSRMALAKFRDHLKANSESLQAERIQQGIGEIGLVNGVYVEERMAKMPLNWPALTASTSTAEIIGSYDNSKDKIIGQILFGADQFKVFKSDHIEIRSDLPTSIQVIAKREDHEIFRKTIPVRQEEGAVIIEKTITAKESELVEGGESEKIYLRKNIDGELVIQREFKKEGKHKKGGKVRSVFLYWDRARPWSK